MLVSWSDSYLTNIEKIDRQHRRLVDMLNQFQAAIRDKRAMPAKGKLLTDLLDYAAYHFGTEEALMQRCGFPGSEQHKREHSEFEEHIAEFQQRSATGGMVLPVELTNFLRDWIEAHIQSTDRDLASFLRSQGFR